jgi:hypothetical protein
MIEALSAVQPSEVVVETHGNQVPAALLDALAASSLPVRFQVSWPLLARDLEPFRRVPRVALEVDLGAPARLPHGFASAFAPLDPDLAPPPLADGGHTVSPVEFP